MNLDDLSAFRALDTRGMLAQINGLPEQLDAAYALGKNASLPAVPEVKQIVVVGMGGAMAGPEMLAALTANNLALPLHIQHHGTLPAWANNPQTLVIVVSNSGESREALSALKQLKAAGCAGLVLTTGGRLGGLAHNLEIPTCFYPHAHVSSTAVGWTFGLLHSVLYRLGWMGDPGESLRDGLHAMRNAQMNLLAEVPVIKNPAKRMAGQLMGRWAVIFSAGYLAPLARRWKMQINQVAKSWAQDEILPSAGYHILEGLGNTNLPLSAMIALFLNAADLPDIDTLHLQQAREFFLQQGINTDSVQARGHSPYAHLWTSLLFADYTACYLALAYGFDPTPARGIESIDVVFSNI